MPSLKKLLLLASLGLMGVDASRCKPSTTLEPSSTPTPQLPDPETCVRTGYADAIAGFVVTWFMSTQQECVDACLAEDSCVSVSWAFGLNDDYCYILSGTLAEVQYLDRPSEEKWYTKSCLLGQEQQQLPE